MSNHSLYWIPLGVFAVLLLQGSLLGLTDDEAYYWVLAQTPALGYAYHPPAVAWLIATGEFLFGWLLGHSPALVRLPAALCAALTVYLALFWMRRAGVAREELGRGAALVLSFVGFFSLAWMIVPDLPLFLGWMLAFLGTWEICFASENRRISLALIFSGTALTLLSKYSGVLAAGSSFLAILFWAPKERRISAILAVFLGGVAAAIPAVIWNAQHEWASLLYQLRDRHGGGGISWSRYAKFWVAEALLAGPLLLAFSYAVIRRSFAGDRVQRFVALWALPGALVFCLQPLWSEFKLHWAFVVWWPLALGFGYAFARREPHARFGRVQAVYGLTLAAAVLLSCHFPVTGWVNQHFAGKEPDPRWDVTNDMYGWRGLGEFLREKAAPDELHFPVVGSRYQTAAQASFALGKGARVTLLPRDLKAKREWPTLGVSESEGPEWPALRTPVFFVADNRYRDGPRFVDSECVTIGRHEERRWGIPAKWIDVWRCQPK